ncbi:hypothetical protein FF36_00934 [Frankia torreyi]|uniref:Uncharacterized protein n=1 Tax=Frankia torreyi TaxID=1856 RepID=A0A0D8BKD8_9ACTN|nr:hypothetical protein FF36_00934 [Frankia torreyi]KQM07735.1 hypothetical protein FF86_1002223 [Frankia sp. CpI1-P]
MVGHLEDGHQGVGIHRPIILAEMQRRAMAQITHPDPMRVTQRTVLGKRNLRMKCPGR